MPNRHHPLFTRILRILIYSLSGLTFTYFAWLIVEVFQDVNQPNRLKIVESSSYSDTKEADVEVHLTFSFATAFEQPEEYFHYVDFEYDQVSEGFYPLQITQMSTNSKFDSPICIQRLYFFRSIHLRRLVLENKRRTFGISPVFKPVAEFNDLCFQGSIPDTEGLVYEESPILIPKTYDNSFRIFPLDGTYGDFFIWLEAIPQAGGAVFSIAPTVDFMGGSLNWNQTITLSRPPFALADRELNVTFVNIDTQRPISIRALVATLLLTLTVFIFALLFVNDVGSALEVAVGILLGIWGIQGILIPDYVSGITLVHIAIYMLYLLFAWVALTRFVLFPLNRKLVRHVSVFKSDTQSGASNEAIDNLQTVENVTIRSNHGLSKNGKAAQLGVLAKNNIYPKITIVLLAIIAFLLGLLNLRKRT